MRIASFIMMVLSELWVGSWLGVTTSFRLFSSSSAKRRAVQSASSSDILCFYTATPKVSGEICHNVTHNEIFRMHGGGVPSILGIGPAKTGSSVLATVLGLHDDIELGDAKRGGRDCCMYELYVLSPRSNDFLIGPQAYEKYFNMRKGAVYVEKTPNYANDRVAPYRAMAMLGQKDLRLIYTFRDSIEALYSLYKHRGYHRNITFNTYAEMMLISQSNYNECRRRVVESQIPPPVSVQSHIFMEQIIDSKCSPELRMGDALTQFDHAGNLRHWRSIFPNTPIVCVNFTAWHRLGAEVDVIRSLYKALHLPVLEDAVRKSVAFITKQKGNVHALPGSTIPGLHAWKDRIASFYSNSSDFTRYCSHIIT